MTIQEKAIAQLERISDHLSAIGEKEDYTDVAIQALEQQTCEDVFYKIKTEIIEKFDNCSICEWFENYDYDENDISEYMSVGSIFDIIDIIDKYRKRG